MANIGEFASAGLAAIQIGARNSSGLFQGYGKLTASDTGDVSGMRRVRGAVTGANPVPDITRIRNRGDDGYIATHLFEAEPPEFNLEFESTDIEVEAFLTSATILALGEWDMAGRGQGIPTLQDTTVLMCRQTESQEVGATGNGYENLLIASAKFRPTPGDYSWQAVGTSVLNGAADRVTTLPWGATVTSAIGQSDLMTMTWMSTFPCTMVALVGDGAEDEFVLPYAPSTVARTKAWRTDTGAALTVSSVNSGAKSITLSAAPASGLLVVVLLEVTDL